MGDDDVAAILATGERMYAAADAGDARAVATIDATLHEQIMKLSGNGTLLRVWRSLEPFSRTYLTLAGPHSDPQWSAHLHDSMLAAVRARDVEQLVDAIEHHFDEVRDSLGKRLAETAAEQAAAAEPGR
jgi:DNA-binding GntR family transcriptional regulator